MHTTHILPSQTRETVQYCVRLVCNEPSTKRPVLIPHQMHGRHNPNAILSRACRLLPARTCARRHRLPKRRVETRPTTVTANLGPWEGPTQTTNYGYTMLCYAMPCHAMLCYAMLCYAMLCYAMLCHAMPRACRGPVPCTAPCSCCGAGAIVQIGACRVSPTWPTLTPSARLFRHFICEYQKVPFSGLLRRQSAYNSQKVHLFRPPNETF